EPLPRDRRPPVPDHLGPARILLAAPGEDPRVTCGTAALGGRGAGTAAPHRPPGAAVPHIGGVRALHGWLAHAGSPRPKNPPEPPLCKGGKGNGPVLLIFPPLRRGGLGGVDSHRPRGVLYSIVNRSRVVPAWTAYLARRQAGE